MSLSWEVEEGCVEEPVELFVWPLGVKTRVGRIVRCEDGAYEWSVTLGDGDDSVLRSETAETMRSARAALLEALGIVGSELSSKTARRRETGSAGHGAQIGAGHPTAEITSSPSPGAELVTEETTLAQLEAIFKEHRISGAQLIAFGPRRKPYEWLVELARGDGNAPTLAAAFNEALGKHRHRQRRGAA